MYRIIRKILSKSVLIVVLFHALIHHSQADQMSVDGHIDIHQDNDSLYNILKILFHETDHKNLDNLVSKKVKQEALSFFSTWQILLAKRGNDQAPEIKAWELIAANIDNNYTETFIVTLNGVRGPPAKI